MKKQVIVGIVVVALVIVVGFVTQLTGRATFTPGADYGPINPTQTYSDCIYVGTNDGWDVMVVGEVEYFDKGEGVPGNAKDFCVGEKTVNEFDCAEGGYRQERKVSCPNYIVCSGGACVESWEA